MTSEKKEPDEQHAATTETLADLPVEESKTEFVTGGLFDNTRGTHVAGTIGAVGNNGPGI